MQWLNCEGRRPTWSSRKAYCRRLRSPHNYNHGSQLIGLGDDFTEGEKPENPEKNQLQQLHSLHKFQVFWESTRGYTQVVTHPAITPPARALNREFSGEIQRADRIRLRITGLTALYWSATCWLTIFSAKSVRSGRVYSNLVPRLGFTGLKIYFAEPSEKISDEFRSDI